MINKIEAFFALLIVGSTAILMITMRNITINQFQKELISKGYAEYNQTTGKWQYKELNQNKVKETAKRLEIKEDNEKSPLEEILQPLPKINTEEEPTEAKLELIPFILANVKKK